MTNIRLTLSETQVMLLEDLIEYRMKDPALDAETRRHLVGLHRSVMSGLSCAPTEDKTVTVPPPVPERIQDVYAKSGSKMVRVGRAVLVRKLSSGLQHDLYRIRLVEFDEEARNDPVGEMYAGCVGTPAISAYVRKYGAK